MAEIGLTEQISQGITEARRGKTLLARMHLEEAMKSTRNPQVLAWYGYCLAKDKKAYGQAIDLCKEALQAAPDNPDLYLATGRIYLLANRKRSAISAFNRGLKMGRNEAIIQQLRMIGLRKAPVFPFLGRDSSINVYIGILLAKLGVR